MEKLAKALEITTFKLRSGKLSDFIRQNTEINDFLKRQPGFCSRTIIKKKNGEIMDILYWTSVENGTQAMHKLMSELAHSPVHQLIDQQSVSWNIHEISHQMNNLHIPHHEK